MKTLLVAQPGGHLQELHRLLPRLDGIGGARTWVTVDTPQARSLLAGEDVELIRGARHPHDLATPVGNLAAADALLRRGGFTHAVSTGSSIAVSFLPLARLRGISCHYIESATRVEGPSLTARLLRAVPGIHLYTQHRRWTRPPWSYRGSVFDGFAVEQAGDAPPVRRIVVTVGSSPYGFASLIARVAELVPEGAEVLWQTGSTDLGPAGLPARASGLPAGESGLPAKASGLPACASVSAEVLAEAMRRADVVIGHAGIGTALTALESGRWPILVPRRRDRGEHVDDHQVQVATDLGRAGLALVRDVGDLRREDLALAAGRRVVDVGVAAPFRLA